MKIPVPGAPSRRPQGPAPSLSILERLLTGTVSKREIAREIRNQAFAGLESFCSIPDGYKHCLLDVTAVDLDGLSDDQLRNLVENPPGFVINPTRTHLQAIEFFTMMLEGHPAVCEEGDPLRPTIGAYLSGPPGVGKTHVMAAYGLRVKRLLEAKLDHVEALIADGIEVFFKQYMKESASGPSRADKETEFVAENGTVKEVKGPAAKFMASIERLKRQLGQYQYQPTDLLYLSFESLVDICAQRERGEAALKALEHARVVFVDDIHPKGDPERFKIISRLIERRYELGRFGTFVTTNIDPEDLGGDEKGVGARILSRCSESFLRINFKNCQDWRQAVKSRKVKLIQQEIDHRLSQRGLGTGTTAHPVLDRPEITDPEPLV